MKVTIAGASGFIGRHLIESLPKDWDIKALSRKERTSMQNNVTWETVELFSFQSTVKALEGTDIAIYLVHSMLPSTRLFQGNFEDTDLLIADNFARACKKDGVKQIIYLGGLCPEGHVSKHLKSRLEVEEVFRATGIPTTVLRAGMIVGNGGSSFEILKNLVINLPAMILPKWTSTLTQVIYVDDLINVIEKACLNEDFYNQTIDVVNGEKLLYKDLIEQTAKYLGKKQPLIPVPINYTSFSKLWVSVFGQSNYELVSPLIDSLLCDLPQGKPVPLIEPIIKYKTYKDMLPLISKEKLAKRSARHREHEDINTVRSIQRLPNPKHFNEKEISLKYMHWLPKHMKYVVTVKEDGHFVFFNLFNTNINLLELEYVEEKEVIDRKKFHIVGGLLCKREDTGWLEFRQVANQKYSLTSINNFVPALPWYIYKYTQAPIHKYVMTQFGHSLEKPKETDT